ncbi:MAG: hypothetical protein AB8B71_10240 [Paracoccaceae bacterium]
MVAAPLLAGQGSLLSSKAGLGARGALLKVSLGAEEGSLNGPPASLFAGRRTGGLFGPNAPRLSVDPVELLSAKPSISALNNPGVIGLRDLIAYAEAGRAGYDAVVWSAKIKTPKPPTQMTLAEIEKWTVETPNQNHAIGRYQFIPNTLRALVAELGLPQSTQFTPQVQDALADLLLEDAGLSGFMAGTISKTNFMNNLAKIWAGLPNSTGKSHYHGFAGNKAVLSWSKFKTEMRRIFPS